MNVLVADDDSFVRLTLRRVLQRLTTCTVVDAQNGLEALEKLESTSFDLALLDLVMPNVGGLELLRLIRSSPDLRDLPVVVVSSVNSEQDVADVIKLGIVDYITKPMPPETIVARLTRALEALKPGASIGRRGELQEGAPLMVVDASDDFRQFFSSVMNPRNPVIAVSSGTQALKECLKSPPAAIFIGPEIGLMTPDVFVQMLRDSHKADETSLVGVWPKSMAETARQSGMFDKVIRRTFVPDVLTRQIDEAFSISANTNLHSLLTAITPLASTATEQVFGMMLALELEDGAAPLPPGREVVASIDLMSDQRGRLGVQAAVPVDKARELASRLLMAEASDEDAEAALAEVVNVIGGRLKKALRDVGVSVNSGLPVASIRDRAEDEPKRDDAVQFWFAGEDGHTLIGVVCEHVAA